MRAIAPGKLLLTGAYAVLEGAPAIVVAVDRHAVADASRVETAPSREVREAIGDANAPHVETRALHDEVGHKLGLGSSAASLVASLGALAVARGEDPRGAAVRARIFRLARDAHARAQGGGSGVDVAASVHGGVVRYSADRGGASVRAVTLPEALSLAVFWSGASARTSNLRGRVAALREAAAVSRAFDDLHRLSARAANAVDALDASAFVVAAREYGRALYALGSATDTPIVPPAFHFLASVAESADAAFLPSGAGGGDVAVWLGLTPPTASFMAHAAARSMQRLPLSVDHDGVRPHSPSS